MIEPLYIDTAQELTALCAQLRGQAWITLDTEFIREKTYYPQLCLIQIASPELVACIDPLALTDFSPLLEVLYDPNTLKVLHAASQDLEIFTHLRGTPPSPVFDTQIAATVLGQGEQVGYGNLVQLLLNVSLDKSQTRTDWSQRPLSAEQIAYAAADVSYLRDIYLQQRTALQQQQRLSWLESDFAELVNPHRYLPDPQRAWSKLKAYALKGVQLNVLRHLAAWREQQAMQADRPRRWILADDALLDLARLMPSDESKLSRLRSLEPAQLRRHATTLLQLVRQARSEPVELWPTLPQRQSIGVEQEALLDALEAVVRLSSLQHKVGAQTLASRKDLEALLSGDPDCPLRQGWRGALVGEALLGFLRGESELVVERGRLLLRAVSA